MKKIFVNMMLASVLLIGGSSMAKAQTDGTTGATQKAQCENVGKACDNCKEGAGQKGKKDKKGDKKGNKGQKGVKGNRPQFNPFDGVQLTDDQQQKLQVLRQGLGPVQLTPQEDANIPVNPNLTPEQKKQLKEEKKAKKLEKKKNYLQGVKEILTPDQYVIFLENCYLYAPQQQGNIGQPRKQAKMGDRNKDRKDKGEKGKNSIKQ